MGPLRPTSSALTICWAQTSAGSGPEVTLNGSLPAHFWAGPTSVHLRFTSAHFCAIPRVLVRCQNKLSHANLLQTALYRLHTNLDNTKMCISIVEAGDCGAGSLRAHGSLERVCPRFEDGVKSSEMAF